MVFTELGDRRRPVVMLLYGQKEDALWASGPVKFLAGRYRVVIPEPAGQEDASRAAQSIRDYVKRHCGGKVYALCGFFSGWEIARELLGSYHVESCKVIVENENGEPGKTIAKLMA